MYKIFCCWGKEYELPCVIIIYTLPLCAVSNQYFISFIKFKHNLLRFKYVFNYNDTLYVKWYDIVYILCMHVCMQTVCS